MPRRVVLGVVLALTVVLVGCSSDGSPRAQSSSSSAAPSTTTATTTTTAPPATNPIVPLGSATEAATAFVNAWRNGDSAAAATIATPAAVDAVFSAGEPGSIQNRGCNTPPGDSPVLCVYRTAVGELQVRVQPGPDGWFVDQAIVSSD